MSEIVRFALACFVLALVAMTTASYVALEPANPWDGVMIAGAAGGGHGQIEGRAR